MSKPRNADEPPNADRQRGTSDRRARLDVGSAALGLLTIAAANALYFSGLAQILDPQMSMDPYYIDMAARPVAGIVGEDPSFGPLYALWLKPFVAALGDPVAVYAANIYGLSIGISVLIYLHLLLRTRRIVPAAGAALFFLISDFNVPLAGKVSDFALLVVLAGFTLSELVPAGARRLSVVAAGVLLASHARPELYPAAPLLCLAASWLAFEESRASGRGVLLWPATVLAATVALAVWIGTPYFSPYHANDRLLLAFREHFAWNWSRWHDQGGTFISIWQKEFGDAQSLLQALARNPRAAAHHLAANWLGTARFMIASAFDHYPLLAPVTRPALVKAESLAAAAAAFGSLGAVAVRGEWRRAMVERCGPVVLPYAVLAACSLGSATLIYPLARYLVLPGVLLMMGAALAATVLLPARPPSPWRHRLAAALVCLVAVPRPFVLPSAYEVADSPFKGRISVSRTITDVIAFIRSLELPAPVHVLTLTDGIGEMLGPGFREIKVWQKGEQPLEAYMRDRHVDVIVALKAGQSSFLFDDAYWPVILNRPEEAGYTRLSVPDQEDVRVYVRSELMQGRGG